MADVFAGIRRTSWTVLAAAAIAQCGATLLVNGVLFQGRLSERLGALYESTGFLIQSALVGGAVNLAIVGAILFGAGRLRASDVGWSAHRLGIGVLVTFGFWAAMNGVLAMVAALHGDLALDEAWTQRGASAVVGALVGQLLANALVEETLFRGYLLPQLYLKAADSFRTRAMSMALVGSSALFAVTHIPNRLIVRSFTGSELLWDQAGLFVFGLIMATAYVVTRNLFVAVGLHALVNAPTPVVGAPNEATLYGAWAALVALLLLVWRVAALRNRSRRPSGETQDTCPHQGDWST